MKVENNNLNPLNTNKADNLQKVDKLSRQVNSSQSIDSKDRAMLSEKARVMAKARVALNDVPPVREQRVQEIKNSVQDGTYTVPIQDLVKNLLKHLGTN
jgi:flagellar biosynthesis anti-sigma factor FlgM